MIPVPSREITTNTSARLGAQPIALAAATLLIVVVGVASIALWRAIVQSPYAAPRAKVTIGSSRP